jgi:hypothetical protein
MRFSASGNVDFTVPGLEYANREMGGGSETEQSHAISLLDACDSQSAEADDPGA